MRGRGREGKLQSQLDLTTKLKNQTDQVLSARQEAVAADASHGLSAVAFVCEVANSDCGSA